MVSKSGSNQVHGSLFEYIRNDALDAAPPNNILPTLPTDVPGGGKRLPPLKRNQFGGSIGGPIKKDKTFVFADLEMERQVSGTPNTATVFDPGCYNSSHQLTGTDPTDLFPAGDPLGPRWTGKGLVRADRLRVRESTHAQ